MGTAASDESPRSLVWSASLASFLLIAQQVAGKAVRDALFLSSYAATALPAVMVASSLASVLAVIGFSRVMARRSPYQVAPLATALAALLLLAEWGLSFSSPRATAVLVYLHLAIFGGTLVSAFWSLMNERFDPWTAKTVVGPVGVGAAGGGVAGGVLAWAAARLWPVSALLLVTGLLGAPAAWLLVRLRPRSRAKPAVRDSGETTTALATLRRVGYLRALAAVVGIGALTEALLDYVLKAEASVSFAPGPQLLSFFALFYTATGLLGLLTQSLLSRPSLGMLGLAGTVSLRPTLVAAAGLLGFLDPRLWTGVLSRGAHAVLSNSLFRSSYELLYTPVPDLEKRPTKSIIDVGFDKLGALAGSTIALLAVALAPAPSRTLLALVVVLSAAALTLAPSLHRGYVDALEQSLRAGRVKLEPTEVVDDATRHTLSQTNLSLDRETLLREIALLRDREGAGPERAGPDLLLEAISDLRSGRADRIRRVLQQEEVDVALVPHFIPLLASNEHFHDVLRVLRRLAPRATGQLVDALLDPTRSSTLRRRLPRVLKACPTSRAVEGLLLGLGDPRLDVRAQCGQALVALTERNPALEVPRPLVFEAVGRELAKGYADAAEEDLPRRLDHVFALLSLVLEREPLKIALWAVRGDEAALRGTALEYLENVLPEPIRDALWPRLGVARTGARSARPVRELIADLRASAAVSGIRGALRRRPARPGRATD
jgi:hypothetical protein